MNVKDMSIKTHWTAADIEPNNRPQRWVLPTVYRRIGRYKLRFVVELDTSYLNQSSAVVESWCPATMTWNQLLRFNVAASFTIQRGPSENGRVGRSELLSPLNLKTSPAALAKSYNKILDRMADEATDLIEFLDVE